MKRMKMKKIFSVLCVLSILTCFIGQGAMAAEELPVNTFPTTAEVNKVIEEEQPLVDAYQEMMESFAAPDGDVVYPDAYAGAYIEDGVLVVNVKENSAFPYMERNNDVVFREVPYSYNDLQELSMRIVSLDIPNVTSIGVSDRDNEVHIGVNENSYPVANSVELDSFKSDVKELVSEQLREYVVSAGFDSDLPIDCFWEEPISVAATTLQGGMGLVNSDTNSNFSMSICGTYYGDDVSGERAVLTCGHAFSVGDTINASGKRLGTAVKKNFTGSERYDYGIIKITNTSGFTSTNRVLNNTNYTTITGISTSNPVGTTICKYGRNGFATGVIIYSDRSVYYSGIGYIHGLVHVTVESQWVGNCGGGDSGCCIYRGHDFYGTYSGDNRDPIDAKNATKFYYSPIYGVMNFSVQTS